MALLPHPRLIAAGVALVLAFGAGWWLRGLQVKAAMVDQTQALAQPCPKLVTLQGATGADVLRWSADTVRKYQLCAAQVEGLLAAWPKR